MGLPLAEIAGVGTNIIGLQDDNFSGPIPIGFNFTFYGTSYSQLYVGSNGVITFGAGFAGAYGAILPNSPSQNSINFANGDLDCRNGTPLIQYFVTGTTPNRKFILNFRNVQSYASPSNITTAQVHLFEGSAGKIEIHITSANSTNASNPSSPILRTIGIQNNNLVDFLSGANLNSTTSLNIQSEMLRFENPNQCPNTTTINTTATCIINSTATLTASPPFNGMETYIWYRDGQVISGINSTLNVNIGGLYKVKKIDPTGSCYNLSEGIKLSSVAVPDPGLSILGPSYEYFCPTQIISNYYTLQSSFKDGIQPPPNLDVAYSWSGPNGFLSSQKDLYLNGLTPNSSGTYTLTATVSNGCTGTFTAKSGINVKSDPGVYVNIIDVKGGCDSLQLEYYFNTLSVNYQRTVTWTGPNGFNSNLERPKIKRGDGGTYVLTVNLIGECGGTYTKSINILPLTKPTLNLYYSQTNISFGLLLSLPTVNDQYQSQILGLTWTGPNGFVSNTTNRPTVSNQSNINHVGTYTATLTTSDCPLPNIKTFNVLNPCELLNKRPNIDTCPGSSIDLESELFGGGNGTFTWTGTNGFSGSGANLTINNIQSSGVYTLTVVVNSGTCAGTYTTTTNVNVNSSAVGLTPENQNSTVCEGDIFSIKLNLLNGSQLSYYTISGPNSFNYFGKDETYYSPTFRIYANYGFEI